MEENGMKDWEYDDDDEEMSIMMRGSGDINNNNYNYDDDDDDKGMRGNMILRLGKKVVIAGVVMSSLPVVVPPLIVMSALGCAVSLPFGLILASYAAADKLMSRLLGGGYVAVDEYDDYKEDVEEEEEEEDEDEEEEERVVEMTAIEILPPPFDQICDNGGGVSSLEDQKQGDDRNGQLISLRQDMKESQASNISNEEDQNINKEDDQNGQLLEQTSLEVEGKPISSDTKDSQASNISNEAETKRKRRQGKRNNNKASKLTTKRTETDDDKKSGLVNVTSTARPEFGPQLPQDVVFATGNIDSSIKTQSKPEEQDVAVHDESNVMNDEISTSEIAVDVPIKDGGNGKQSDTIAAADGELKNDERVTELKEEKDATALDSGSYSSEEGLIGEEMFWKKMNVIRAIVGYKAPKRDSYIEEIKALYLFTGIEPPSDSAEFHYKLSFLMSVIGLK